MRYLIAVLALSMAAQSAGAFPIFSAMRAGSGGGALAADQNLGTLGCVFTAPDTIDCPSASSYTLKITNSGAGAAILHVDGNLVWHAGNDGIGSQLNADFLDDISSSGYCQVTGGAACTVTGIVLSGTNDDITSTAAEDLSLVAPASQAINLRPNGEATGGGLTVTEPSGTRYMLSNIGNNANAVSFGPAGDPFKHGSKANRGADERIDCVSESIGGTDVDVMCITGTGVIRAVPNTALTISGTPDSTTAPTASGTSCRMSAAAGQSWTPAEANAVSGDFVCCTNTGTNAITITESATVYEGPTVSDIVGQWDQVCMEYVTDRWVRRGASDN